jgi:hypothetical protein
LLVFKLACCVAGATYVQTGDAPLPDDGTWRQYAIGALIDWMQVEHLAHRDTIAHITPLLAKLPPLPPFPPSLPAAVWLPAPQVPAAELFEVLDQRILIEEDVPLRTFVTDPPVWTSNYVVASDVSGDPDVIL